MIDDREKEREREGMKRDRKREGREIEGMLKCLNQMKKLKKTAILTERK